MSGCTVVPCASPAPVTAPVASALCEPLSLGRLAVASRGLAGSIDGRFAADGGGDSLHAAKASAAASAMLLNPMYAGGFDIAAPVGARTIYTVTGKLPKN